MSDRKFHVAYEEFEDPHAGGTGIKLVVREEVEVAIATYGVNTEAQEGDVFLHTQEGRYTQELVFRRLVPLSEDEEALAQAVYAKTKDFTW